MSDLQKVETIAIKGLIISVLVVMIGHILGGIVTDNFYWEGLQLKKKTKFPVSPNRQMTI